MYHVFNLCCTYGKKTTQFENCGQKEPLVLNTGAIEVLHVVFIGFGTCGTLWELFHGTGWIGWISHESSASPSKSSLISANSHSLIPDKFTVLLEFIFSFSHTVAVTL